MYPIRYIAQNNVESRLQKKKLHKDIFRLGDKNARARIGFANSVGRGYQYIMMSHYVIIV